MKPLLAAVALTLFALPAHADIAVPRHRIRPVPTVHLSSVRVARTDAPDDDTTAVAREARRALHAQRGRIDRCLRGVDLRRSPFRSGTRSMRGRLVFTRSGRPTVQIEHARGIPRAARACVLEAVESVATRTAPRGTVEVRFRYDIR